MMTVFREEGAALLTSALLKEGSVMLAVFILKRGCRGCLTDCCCFCGVVCRRYMMMMDDE